MELANVHPMEIEELACHLLEIDYDEIDGDESVIDEKMIDAFECDLNCFGNLIRRLLPLIDVGESPITKKQFKGFAENGRWLARTEL